ncbi:hypothetical protein BRYFOR_06116 [Marvinbryantia formatexigens DSM 14469]|uniref:Uncharacterized protein n=1 Tax=Marvinbryantia formatexigens DSM 14469 TaxID=478749 RepID=C6LBX1_9FIRM|nr:hypothetical protein BRYFOR_06116 [Marvinbryantia formatexigens DSM 14469]
MMPGGCNAARKALEKYVCVDGFAVHAFCCHVYNKSIRDVFGAHGIFCEKIFFGENGKAGRVFKNQVKRIEYGGVQQLAN